MSNDFLDMDSLFEKARNEAPLVSAQDITQKFSADISSGKTVDIKGNFKLIKFLKTFSIMISIISISTVAIYLFTANDPEIKPETLTNSEIMNNSDTEVHVSEVITATETIKESGPITIESVEIIDDSICTTTTTYLIPESVESTPEVKIEKVKVKNEVEPQYIEETISKTTSKAIFRFPKLTPEEIEANNKQKEKMIKELAKIDDDKFAYIPSGSFLYNGKPVSVQAFYMQKTEVTNLEYRTFLFDLLINGREKDFLIAKPEQFRWLEIEDGTFNEPMEQSYFSHPAYNSYPVVNVTREGVKMYCDWLTSEAHKTDIKKAKFTNNQQVRLPFDTEWMYAAYGKDPQYFLYPWNTNSIKNPSGCYLANFKPSKDSICCLGEEVKKEAEKKKGKETVDEQILSGEYLSANSDSTQKVESEFKYMADGAFYTAKVGTYVPNNYGLYNLIGNVAEMVTDWPQKTPGTKGGGWFSELKDLAINADDPYKGMTDGHPNVGFRVVFTYFSEHQSQNTQGNNLKIDKNTTKADLEILKNFASKNGLVMDYKAKVFNNKLVSITLTIDNDNDPTNCGAIYYHNSFLTSKDAVLVSMEPSGETGYKLDLKEVE